MEEGVLLVKKYGELSKDQNVKVEWALHHIQMAFHVQLMLSNFGYVGV